MPCNPHQESNYRKLSEIEDLIKGKSRLYKTRDYREIVIPGDTDILLLALMDIESGAIPTANINVGTATIARSRGGLLSTLETGVVLSKEDGRVFLQYTYSDTLPDPWEAGDGFIIFFKDISVVIDGVIYYIEPTYFIGYVSHDKDISAKLDTLQISVNDSIEKLWDGADSSGVTPDKDGSAVQILRQIYLDSQSTLKRTEIAAFTLDATEQTFFERNETYPFGVPLSTVNLEEMVSGDVIIIRPYRKTDSGGWLKIGTDEDNTFYNEQIEGEELINMAALINQEGYKITVQQTSTGAGGYKSVKGEVYEV